MEEMKKFFKPEFLNRLDDTIVFRQLTLDEIKKIGSIMLKEVSRRLKTKGIESLCATESFMNLVAKEGYEPAYGARPLRRAIMKLLEDANACWGNQRGRFHHCGCQRGRKSCHIE